jgi:hypothetical protein
VKSVTVSVPVFRKRSRAVALATEPRAVRRRPAAIAKALALAHHIQAAIDRGTFSTRVDMARRLGLSGARMTQFLTLLLLAPDIQERLLELEAIDGVEPITEKQVRRRLCSEREWARQREYLARPLGAARRPKRQVHQ